MSIPPMNAWAMRTTPRRRTQSAVAEHLVDRAADVPAFGSRPGARRGSGPRRCVVDARRRRSGREAALDARARGLARQRASAFALARLADAACLRRRALGSASPSRRAVTTARRASASDSRIVAMVDARAATTSRRHVIDQRLGRRVPLHVALRQALDDVERNSRPMNGAFTTWSVLSTPPSRASDAVAWTLPLSARP